MPPPLDPKSDQATREITPVPVPEPPDPNPDPTPDPRLEGLPVVPRHLPLKNLLKVCLRTEKRNYSLQSITLSFKNDEDISSTFWP